MQNNEDIGWRFGTKLDQGGRKVEFTFCKKQINGGITRLKEHLAHKKGNNVASCPSVSDDVRKEMWALLTKYNVSKNEKEKPTREFEDDIAASYRANENDDAEDEDQELAYARQQSLMQHKTDHYRESRPSTDGAGGSGIVPQMRRSGSCKETCIRGGVQRPFQPANTPTSRLGAVELDLEKDKRKNKQPKKSKKGAKEAEKSCMGHFMIDTNMPFRAIESPYANPLMETILEVYLSEEYKEMKNYIKSLVPIWDERGVTIMCDGWGGPTNMSIINFLIYSVRGTIFHKSIDASDVLRKDTDYYYKLMKEVVDEIGAHRVVQVVTDNKAAMKAAGKKLMENYKTLYWTACAAHCQDLLLEDLGNRSSIKKVISRARLITKFIYTYKWVTNYMKKFTNGRELTRPGMTRFATDFIMLEKMFHSTGWLTSRYSQITDNNGMEVHELLSRNLSQEVAKFWNKADQILKIQEPIVKVLKLVDGDTQPTMGFIYEAMERCKLAIKQNCESYRQYWAMIDKRWNFQLHHDLHAACISLR
ncbi:hypothetical protein RND81_09G071200 [Saponaria officinalis]|uniref:DUF659 domain-containing protein n=1 Tax=Saponaria officinalis TaxID=3572 RepID=A0AAW1IJB8_SAPOF